MNTMTFYGLLSRLLIISFLFVLTACPPSTQDDVTPAVTATALSDANELSKVMIIPDATLEQGSPPPVTTASDTPKLSTSTPEVNAISGQDATFSLNYSNAAGNITVIYIQFEGSDYYFRVPISSNSGTNGTIKVPMRIPEKYTAVSNGKSFTRFCCFAASAQGTRQAQLCNNNFTSNLLPKPGKGTATISGRNYEATAVCDMDLGGFGKAYGILINDTQFIALYNLKRGAGNQLVDIINGNYTIESGVPWAGYFDGTNFYFSVSGSASYNGSAVSVSGRFADMDGRQISVSAAGNCQ